MEEEKRGRYFLRLLDSVVIKAKEKAKSEGLSLSSYIEELILMDVSTERGGKIISGENFELEQHGAQNAGRPGETSSGNVEEKKEHLHGEGV